jgi:hypothetical protein
MDVDLEVGPPRPSLWNRSVRGDRLAFEFPLGPHSLNRQRYAIEGSTIGHATMTMHDFEAKHWIFAAVIVLLAVGAFVYSWA